MALIYCPNCGKRITDRTEICPQCHTVLIKKDDTPVVSKESILSDGKKTIPAVAVAGVESLVFTRLLAAVFGILCHIFTGEDGRRAFTEGSRAFRVHMFVILLIGCIALSILPAILHKITRMKVKSSAIVVSAVLALLFGISYLSYSTAFHVLASARDIHGYGIVGETVIDYARCVPFFYAAALPLYQGMFYLLNQNVYNKSGYVSQAVFAGIALALTVISALIGIALLGMGTSGAVLAGVLSSVILFALAAIRK